MRLHSYQEFAKNFVTQRLSEQPGVGLWLDCGLGKTATTLHAIDELMRTSPVRRVLVIAPLRVTYLVWRQEAEKWNFPFRFALLHGRKKAEALKQDADIYLINVDGIPWLEKTDAKFDLVVVDEVTAFKNWSAKRTKSLRRLLLRIPKRITLTGTPVPNSLGDIFSQQYIIDDGKTLGTRISHFRANYMQPGGFENRQWVMRKEKETPLMDAIKPWYLHQSAVDHLDMPDLIKNEIEVELPPKAHSVYQEMAKEMLAEISQDSVKYAPNGGAKYIACRQIASGGLYDNDSVYQYLHDAKTDAVEELVESLNGKPLLLAYCFKHDWERIHLRFGRSVLNISGGVVASEMMAIIDRFKTGKVPILAVQCQALSHGIDGLQAVCNDVCWYSPTDQPEIRHQLESRIYRQGVKGQVRVHYIIAKGTVDVAIKRVLDRKGATQAGILDFIRSGGSGPEPAADCGGGDRHLPAEDIASWLRRIW